MKKEVVGKIKNIKLSEDNELEITIKVTDSKFKKKILRDLSLSGLLEFNGDKMIFSSPGDDDASI